MKKYLALAVIALALTLMFVSCNGDKQTTTEPAHTHTPGAWVTIKEPSCQLGEQSQFCATCGEVIQTLPIAATGLHKEVIDVAVPATCTSTGLTEGKHCLSCGKIFVAQMETPKTAHTYDDSKDETCNTCDFVRDTSCKHTDVTVYEAKNANCIEAGITEGIVCNSCEEVLQTQQVIDALGHDEIIDKGYEATCTTAGLSDGKHCDRCGEVLVVQSYIKELGHTESDWVIEKEPTETEDGYKYKTCSICKQKIQEEVIPFIGDLGLDYTVNADGKTCTVTGIGTFDGAKLDIPDFIRQYKVTAIGDNAFSECIQLTEINLPETLVTIGTRAFYGCTGITEITIPESVKNIGTQIFYKAENLQTVYYNSTYGSSSNNFMSVASIKKVVFGGKYIPSSALYNCANVEMVEIVSNIMSIGYNAFYGCSSLTSITIPDSVTSISSGAFSGCSSLTSITIPDSVTSIDDSAFRDCSSLTSITIPDSVTSIGSSAFNGCSSLTSIEIPDYVTSINGGAFWGCSSLTSIEIPDYVTSIGSNTFDGCTSLTSITIPDSVTSIGMGAFQNCSSLTSITIPDSVTSIDNSAFNGCTLLTSIEIPDSVTSIGKDAFFGCTSLAIYCKLESQPSGWDSNWDRVAWYPINGKNYYSKVPVIWGSYSESVTITFDSIDNRTSFNAVQQIWSVPGIAIVNNRGDMDITDYHNPVRFYSGSQLIVVAKDIIKIEFRCNTEGYAGSLANTLPEGTVYTISGNVVTITFTEAVDRLEIDSLSAQVRVDSITVYSAE